MMAKKQIAVVIMKVHAIAFAITKHLTVSAFALTRPFPLTEFLEFVIPNINKAIFIYIPLMVVSANTRTS